MVLQVFFCVNPFEKVGVMEVYLVRVKVLGLRVGGRVGVGVLQGLLVLGLRGRGWGLMVEI